MVVLTRHCFDAGVESALMPGCLVFLDDSAVRHSVDHRHGRIIGGAGVVSVTRVGCRDNLLNLGAN